MARKIQPDEPATGVRTTVVIPVWGQYIRWLPSAVNSLRTQGVPVRIVVIDNASPGPLAPIEGAEIHRLPRRLTLGATRNHGLAQVRTPYVVFWDADDVALPGTLASLQEGIAADDRLVAYGMAIQEADSGERHRWPRRRLAQLVRFPRLLAILHSIWSQYPTTGATIIRTEAARAGGGFSDADSGDDWCLGVSLVFRGRLGWSERPGRVYRLHEGSVWSTYFSLGHQRQHAEIVRRRLRADPGIPVWAKRLLPAIWLGQNVALLAHLAVNAVRRRRAGSG